jgi:S-adenosylmethionine synthetase
MKPSLNVLAQKAATKIAELEGVKEAYVTLVSKIGSSINQASLATSFFAICSLCLAL